MKKIANTRPLRVWRLASAPAYFAHLSSATVSAECYALESFLIMHDEPVEPEFDDYSVYSIARDSSISINAFISSMGATLVYTFEVSINGKGLRELLYSFPAGKTMHSCLVEWGEGQDGLMSLKDLLLLRKPTDHYSGRIPLLASECCGDIGCGGVVVRITETSDFFVWSDFHFEAHSEVPSDAIEHIGPFRFPKDEYIAAIEGAGS